MLTLRIVLGFVLAINAFAETVSAGGGFLQALPKDGTWVKYDFASKTEQYYWFETFGTMTLRFVGTVTKNGERFRWIEIDEAGKQNTKKEKNQKYRNIMKFLIREKHILAGGKKGVEILRGWQAHESDRKKFSSEIGATACKTYVARLLVARWENSKTVKQPITFNCQKGKMNVKEALAGKLDLNFYYKADWGGHTFPVRQTLWIDRNVPTAVAALKIVREGRNTKTDEVGFRQEAMYHLIDYGTGAKSALPEKK